MSEPVPAQRYRIAVFAKAPVPGKVKSRLGAVIGMTNAARIYRRMVTDTLNMLGGIDSVPVDLWCHPGVCHPFFLQCTRSFGVKRCLQSGNDLGQRMMNVFKYAYLRHQVAIIVGSDLPDLDAKDVEQTIQSLESGTDCVILPTYDGGYGLIALRKPDPSLFVNMHWSRPDVLRHTIGRLKKRGLTYQLLLPKSDIDTREDFIRYYKRAVSD